MEQNQPQTKMKRFSEEGENSMRTDGQLDFPTSLCMDTVGWTLPWSLRSAEQEVQQEGPFQ